MGTHADRKALICAIRAGDVDRVCDLLDSGFSPDTVDENNIPGLAIAAQLGHTAIVEVLLAAGVSLYNQPIWEPKEINGEWGGWTTPVYMAVWAAAVAEQLDVIQVLKSVIAQSFIFIVIDVCRQGNLEVLKTLIEFIEVEQLSEFNSIIEDSPLLAAAAHGNLDIVKFLVGLGVEVDQWGKGKNPLMSAAYTGQIAVYNYLYPLVSEETQDYAANALKETLKHQERARRTDVENLIDSAMLGQLEIVQSKIKRGVELDAIGTNNKTALMYAASYGHVPIVEALLDAGANPAILSDEGKASQTALMMVASSYFAGDRDAVVRLFSLAGANLDFQDSEGLTALIYAALCAYTDAVAALIDCGANLDIRDRQGNTALMYAQSRYYDSLDTD
ncbi:MAG: ankyrin repeat domain-containing protein [Spirulina sp. SIO3F2]|nr:ankyrin repeat domain-containing protein [Spirulina sp. SIO3F2]